MYCDMLKASVSIAVYRAVEARLGGACKYGGIWTQLSELQAANPGIPEEDLDFKAVVGKQSKAQRQGEVTALLYYFCVFSYKYNCTTQYGSVEEGHLSMSAKRVLCMQLIPIKSSCGFDMVTSTKIMKGVSGIKISNTTTGHMPHVACAKPSQVSM